MQIGELKEKAYKKTRHNWYALNVTHRCSILIVKLIYKRDISPDFITLLSIISGLIACAFFLLAGPFSCLIGALFLQGFYILDAVDGQLARAQGRPSTTGAYFDYISNHIVHSLVFITIGLGLYRHTASPLYMFAGFLAGWGMLFMYIIYDAGYNILFNTARKGMGEARQGDSIEVLTGHAKRSFMVLHWLCTYPAIMNVITMAALLNLIFFSGNGVIFRCLIVFYAVSLNAVWFLKFLKRIKIKELDSIGNCTRLPNAIKRGDFKGGDRP
ncbi:MAG: CDP-alcohol phosphatidyltransferase family protein, partial [Candidatus Omnitrophica bacterium]|nr:CDP-alcohol phosphatidyltransferase family protein [Candidatus Omnitrophota bacterium]